MNPTVSVIIPTYNHREYVVETLESVFTQTFKDYEVIVVNDGSPDDTEERLQSYIKKGKIRYFCQDNSGQASARNRGIAEATGELIAFLDDDDVWPVDKLAWQVAELNANTELIAVGGSQVRSLPFLPASEQPVRLLISTDTCFSGCPFGSPGQTLIRAEVLRELGGLNPAIWGADDLDLYIRLARRGSILYVGRPSLFYRLHSSNASNDLERMLRNVAECLRHHLKETSLQYSVKRYHDGASWLYSHYGRLLIGANRYNKWRSVLRVISLLWPWLACNPRVLFWFARDVFRLPTNRRLASANCRT